MSSDADGSSPAAILALSAATVSAAVGRAPLRPGRPPRPLGRALDVFHEGSGERCGGLLVSRGGSLRAASQGAVLLTSKDEDLLASTWGRLGEGLQSGLPMMESRIEDEPAGSCCHQVQGCSAC